MNLVQRITRGLSNRSTKSNKSGRGFACERLEGRQLFSTYLVTSLADSGVGSLRTEIAAANAHAGADTINFKAGLTGTITLTGGELLDTGSVTINGPGYSKLAISGDSKSRVLYFSNTASAVAINGVAITKGLATPGFGAGIENYANLTLNNVLFNYNVSGSRATSGGVGGGGGALMNYGHATINQCTFDSNTAISADLSNYGGGAIFNDGTMNLNKSTISNDNTKLGPGLPSHSGAVAGAGGIYNSGNLAATNDTIAYNVAGGGAAGGIYNTGGAFLLNCTIVHNTGGFLAGGVESPGALTIGNDIIALNSYIANHGPSPDLDVTGTFANDGYNLLGVAPSNLSFGPTNLKGTLASPLNPDLGALQFNGGPTKTMALAFASPAYNKGSNTLANFFGLTTDQRGDARIENGTVDIGAYESLHLIIVI